MPTTVVKTVKSGGDYSTWQSAEDALPADIRAGSGTDEIWEFQGAGSFSSASNLLTVSGTLTDSTHWVHFTTEAGASFRDNASVQSNALRFNSSNGCAITLTGGYATAIICNQAYTRFSNLQVAATSASPASPLSCQPDTAGLNSWDFCILESSSTSGTGTNYGNVIHRNCLHVNRFSGAARIARFSGTNVTAINCTFAVPSDKTKATVGVDSTYPSAQIFKNCAIFGATDASSTTNRTHTTCYVDDASPPSGCTQVTYDTALFVNITDSTRDYRLLTGSSLLDVGTTDATNAPNDIAGTARPSGSAYDVGCWELVQGGAAAPKALMMMGVG